MKLRQVDTLKEAREKLQTAAGGLPLRTDMLPLAEAGGRVLAADVPAADAVPAFRKSTMDGYAVRAADTQGAGDSIPCFLIVVDTIQIGRPPQTEIGPGECAYVPTGGMMPAGADAVVMVEYAEAFDESGTQIAVYQAVSPGQYVIGIGEDIRAGAPLLRRGTRLRPQEIGALAAVGCAEVEVYAPPTISIFSTGNELVDAAAEPAPAQVRDINSYTVAARSRAAGLAVRRIELLRDDRELLRQRLAAAMRDSDLVAVSGGSSQGTQDFTADVLDELTSGGVFTHGIALKPGKPTILAYDGSSRTLMIGLPGHPAAAMLVFELLVVRFLRRCMDVPDPPVLRARMETNVAGGAGRAVCQLVQLHRSDTGEAGAPPYLARPILGKSGLITTLVRADGYTLIDHNREGLKKGEAVNVTPL
ncbi:MAG: gephyrin-like molybdotransferase Glp [Anaerovoracaceae bacterium]|jgi:molybdopterin molybdotransferase